jgi:SnoaL-like protein
MRAMTDITTTVDDYIAAWNEGDDQRRRELVSRTFADDATYVDPLISSEGPDGIAGMIGAVQQQYAGHRFELAAGPDAHHDCVRFTWHLKSAEDAHVATGIDFATVANDGRLRTVIGFLEPPAAA